MCFLCYIINWQNILLHVWLRHCKLWLLRIFNERCATILCNISHSHMLSSTWEQGETRGRELIQQECKMPNTKTKKRTHKHPKIYGANKIKWMMSKKKTICYHNIVINYMHMCALTAHRCHHLFNLLFSILQEHKYAWIRHQTHRSIVS